MTKNDAASAAVQTDASLGPFYEPHPGIFDEMMGPGASIAPGWQPLVNWFSRAPAEVQAGHAQKIEQHVFEHFAEAQRESHPWRLDLLPLILDASIWQSIEQAAIQRAVLYQALLADLYGPQSVIADGLLPSALVHSDGSFLRPMHGIAPSAGHLTFLALDFARDPAGNWRVIDTHTETPAGHGFALANRMVISEVAGTLFRQSNAMRIGPFYQRLMDELITRSGSEDPLIAVLAPPPEASAFAGHSFMARYMGQKRIMGSDLRVVGNRVYLKTIDGLKKIDLLVRAIEGHLADPLELSPQGFDGPVGLVEACRQNPNFMVNFLGTAVVENRGLSGYLDKLCQRFLGQDLFFKDTPRLWLGDPRARDQVLANLDRYVIHSAQEGTGSPGEAEQGRTAATMSPEQRAELINEIRFRGPLLVAEEPVGFATAPAWTPNGLRPEPYALRVFVSSMGGQFAVMPGGLALSVDAGTTVALSSSQARSRDVWVISDDHVLPNISLKRLAAQTAAIQRKAQPLQSRAADNLFWLGRYTERADTTLRIVRQILHRSAADLQTLSSSPSPGRLLVRLLKTGKQKPGGAAAREMDADTIWGSLRDLCTSSEKFNALPVTLEQIRTISIQCRDRLSEDSWRVLASLKANDIGRQLAAPGGQTAQSADAMEIIDASERLIERLSAFAGMSHENMTRNEGWLFLDLGRRIERAHHLATLLLSMFEIDSEGEFGGDDMIFALQTADSFITFRSRYRFAPELHLVLDLLVFDETNPRGLAYQLAAISEHIGRLPKSADDAVREPDQRLALDLLTKVRLADVDKLSEVDKNGHRPALAALCNALIAELPKLSELISRQYFSLADEQPHRLHFPTPR